MAAQRARRASRGTLAKTSLAVTAAATAGGVATRPDSSWYESLNKPSWQPPPPVFGLVWTPLYGLIAWAGARALDSSATSGERAGLRRAFGWNLALNAAWTPLFFTARAPRAALVEVLALNAANVLLVRRAWRADRRAAVLLAPYLGWTAFATALNTAIVRRNPRG
ncbi:TspO/MBR family protein [Actinomadura hibisca]|uniref:TspO/MBR family protein n=1 Tax=Actinomadura hibisca TaxID=68565 RepID=UPI000835C207|nr:TspO/MBR family protein [Actinomadura hibisca]